MKIRIPLLLYALMLVTVIAGFLLIRSQGEHMTVSSIVPATSLRVAEDNVSGSELAHFLLALATVIVTASDCYSRVFTSLR